MLVHVESKLAASQVECSNLRCDAHDIAECASRGNEDAAFALMAVVGEVADAIKQNVAIIGPKLKDSLTEMSTQVEMELKIAISHT